MSGFKRGDTVRQKVKPIEGVITGFVADNETGASQALVSWTDEDGHEQSRGFPLADLENTTADEPPAENTQE